MLHFASLAPLAIEQGWPAVYYRLSPTATGFEGALHEVDLNVLAVPPDAGNMRPIKPGQVHAAEPGDHWLPRLIIE